MMFKKKHRIQQYDKQLYISTQPSFPLLPPALTSRSSVRFQERELNKWGRQPEFYSFTSSFLLYLLYFYFLGGIQTFFLLEIFNSCVVEGGKGVLSRQDKGIDFLHYHQEISQRTVSSRCRSIGRNHGLKLPDYSPEKGYIGTAEGSGKGRGRFSQFLMQYHQIKIIL